MADVYALGVMLYQMLAGRPPFVGEGDGDVLVQHLQAEPPPLAALVPNLPPALAALVHRMLARDPAERPIMSEVAAGLERLGGRPDPAESAADQFRPTALVSIVDLPATVNRLADATRRSLAGYRRLTARVAAGGVLLLGLAGVWLLREQRGAAPAGPPQARPPQAPVRQAPPPG